MKVTDNELRGLKELFISFKNKYDWPGSTHNQLISIIEELQSLRKIDIAHTLKYAEEAGAAIEELKHGVEEAIKEIDKVVSVCGTKNSLERNHGIIQGSEWAVYIIKKHVSEYLDE